MRSPLHDRHEEAGVRWTEFAGWEMPLQFTSIVEEHRAVRSGVGAFDVSHLGRVELRGAKAGARLRSVTTYDVTALPPGAAHYSLFCTPEGGIADDVFIYRIADDRWLVVQNAANHGAGLARLQAAAAAVCDVRDVTASTVMLAVQGPDAVGLVSTTLGWDAAALRRWACTTKRWRGAEVTIGRTGYTGEDGVEIVTEIPAGTALWDALLAGHASPAGLGARDTLRLEAALPLHGQDLTTETDPYEAGLGWAVTLDDGEDFVGRDPLAGRADRPSDRRLRCLRATGRGVPRAKDAVRTAAGGVVGSLTSGGFGPTLETGIAMAYLPAASSQPGAEFVIEGRRGPIPARVVRRPFYRRTAAP